jgi:hypothetical protein
MCPRSGVHRSARSGLQRLKHVEGWRWRIEEGSRGGRSTHLSPDHQSPEHVPMGLAVPVPRHRQRGRWGAHPCTNEVWRRLGALTLCTVAMRGPSNEERLPPASRIWGRRRRKARRPQASRPRAGAVHRRHRHRLRLQIGLRIGPRGATARSRGRRSCYGAEEILHGPVLEPPPPNLCGPTSPGDSQSSLELCRHPAPLGAGAPPLWGGRWHGESRPPLSSGAAEMSSLERTVGSVSESREEGEGVGELGEAAETGGVAVGRRKRWERGRRGRGVRLGLEAWGGVGVLGGGRVVGGGVRKNGWGVFVRTTPISNFCFFA